MGEVEEAVKREGGIHLRRGAVRAPLQIPFRAIIVMTFTDGGCARDPLYQSWGIALASRLVCLSSRIAGGKCALWGPLALCLACYHHGCRPCAGRAHGRHSLVASGGQSHRTPGLAVTQPLSGDPLFQTPPSVRGPAVPSPSANESPPLLNAPPPHPLCLSWCHCRTCCVSTEPSSKEGEGRNGEWGRHRRRRALNHCHRDLRWCLPSPGCGVVSQVESRKARHAPQ